MPSRAELKKLALTRLEEAKILYQHAKYDGAKYLLGYVVEMALKARICKLLDSDYPDSGEIAKSYLTHKYDLLVKLGGLQKTLDEELNRNLDFKTNWSIATNWTEALRYKKIGTVSKNDVETLIDALENKPHGVLTWIKKRW